MKNKQRDPPVPEAKFTEFQMETRNVALIADTDNERAWVQSDTYLDVET